MEIRRIRADEWLALRALRLRAVAADPEAFGDTLADVEGLPDDTWRSRSSDPDAPVFVADSPDGLVAMAVGAPAPEGRLAAALYSMWVAPEVRGRGVGGDLVDAVVEWARASGYPAIGLGVTLDNTAAIALYARHGFSDTGERWKLREDTDLEIMIMVRGFAEGS